MKRLFWIFALLLCYCCVPASAHSIFKGQPESGRFVTLSQCQQIAHKVTAVKKHVKFWPKNTFNHRKKAMRGDELAWSPAVNSPYKASSCTDINLFFIQADYFLRPFFGHSKRGPPAIQ